MKSTKGMKSTKANCLKMWKTWPKGIRSFIFALWFVAYHKKYEEAVERVFKKYMKISEKKREIARAWWDGKEPKIYPYYFHNGISWRIFCEFEKEYGWDWIKPEVEKFAKKRLEMKRFKLPVTYTLKVPEVVKAIKDDTSTEDYIREWKAWPKDAQTESATEEYNKWSPSVEKHYREQMRQIKKLPKKVVEVLQKWWGDFLATKDERFCYEPMFRWILENGWKKAKKEIELYVKSTDRKSFTFPIPK